MLSDHRWRKRILSRLLWVCLPTLTAGSCFCIPGTTERNQIYSWRCRVLSGLVSIHLVYTIIQMSTRYHRYLDISWYRCILPETFGTTMDLPYLQAFCTPATIRRPCSRSNGTICYTHGGGYCKVYLPFVCSGWGVDWQLAVRLIFVYMRWLDKDSLTNQRFTN
jgi:hypothetical protein